MLHPGTCILVSLKYSPVFWSLANAMRDGLHAAGFPTARLLSQDYRWMMNGENGSCQFPTTSRNVATMLGDAFRYVAGRRRWYRQFLADNRPAALLFLNPHPLNFAVARLAKEQDPAAQAIVFLHEPHKYDKAAFAPHRRLYFHCVERFQRLSVAAADVVVVHSPRAEQAFRRAYPRFAGDLRRVPLLFPDSVGDPEAAASADDRRFVTFLGHAVESKGFDKFLEVVQAAVDRGAGLPFQIVTRSRIDRGLARLDSKARGSLTVVQGRAISDEAIDRAVRASVAILAPYRAVTQSAVVPVAFRNGTPVIATAIEGLLDVVSEGRTGFLVSRDPSVEEFLEAIQRAGSQLESLSRHCRAEFDSRFSARHWPREYAWLVERLAPPSSAAGPATGR